MTELSVDSEFKSTERSHWQLDYTAFCRMQGRRPVVSHEQTTRKYANVVCSGKCGTCVVRCAVLCMRFPDAVCGDCPCMQLERGVIGE